MFITVLLLFCATLFVCVCFNFFCLMLTQSKRRCDLKDYGTVTKNCHILLKENVYEIQCFSSCCIRTKKKKKTGETYILCPVL